MLKECKKALTVLCLFTLLTGVVYPALVTLCSQWIFPFQANGSLIEKEGSILLAQPFSQEKYFWGRSDREAFAPSDPRLVSTVKQQIDQLQKEVADKRIPIDLVSASGSRVDPDISPQAAYYQVSRIIKARKVSRSQVEALIEKHIEPRTLGLLGEPRVNVWLLNRDLDKLRV